MCIARNNKNYKGFIDDYLMDRIFYEYQNYKVVTAYQNGPCDTFEVFYNHTIKNTGLELFRWGWEITDPYYHYFISL